ncbi:MAG TPA: SGNH hydrolase domain-containing protein [Solirubrobacteraceae bacterium]|nr:SGNH hydrolase domain-containing protein [Solirubrobacteraceae bacterium]
MRTSSGKPWSLGAALLAAVALAAPAAAAAKTPPCFGAAARDAANPCDNPELHLTARPSPRAAPLLPALTCTFVRLPQPHVCAFATSRRRSRGSIALVGDSHAPAWRAAVDVLARGRRWRGLTLAKSSCPFSFARPRGMSDDAWGRCDAWVRDVLRWFRRHPEVHTVFLVNSGAYAWAEDAGVEGYRAALDMLPPTVKHVVVIRDNPKAADSTLPCVARALRRRERPDQRCALPRDEALLPDVPGRAAPRLAGGRGHAIDLSPFFCDDRLCYPVVGGALVFKDTSHITKVFSRTLGPYLAREYRALGLPTP